MAFTADADRIVPTVTMASGLEAAPRPRRAITGWMLFDWAAQPFHTLLLTFFFARYFTTGVMGDGAQAQTLWGTMLAVTGIGIALLSPVLGAIADAVGPRKPWVALFTAMTIAGTAALWIAVPDADATTVFLTLVAFAVAMVGVEFAAVFNNAMMTDLVPRERLGRLSGSSWALGYAGGVVVLLLVLAFAIESSPGSGRTLAGLTPILGLADIPGGGDRFTGPLTAVWMAVFIVPFFLFTPDQPRRTGGWQRGVVSGAVKDLANTVRNLPRNRSLFAYLGSSMFYRDALNGLYAFGGVYAGGVLGWSATKLGVFGILAAFTGVIGAFAGGRLDDRFGPKRVVSVSIVALSLVSLAIVLTDKDTALLVDVAPGSALPDIVFYCCGALIGAFGGALQAASRTLLADQADPGRMTEAFGLYALSGKATSFLAPALIAFTTGVVAVGWLGLGSEDAQRLGISPIVGLFLIGLLLLPLVRARVE